MRILNRIALATVAGAAVLGLSAPAYAVSSGPGADYSWYRPSVSQLRSAGVVWVARYIVPASYHSGKALTFSEAASLRANGVTIVLNYELTSGSARGGYSAGVRDAQRAEVARREVGAPANLPIYFSIDYDERNTARAVAYLQGVASVLGRSRVGVYGSYRVVTAALAAGFPYAWQTYAWSGGKWSPWAQIRQTKNGALWGGQGDKDTALRDFGGWGPGYTAPSPAQRADSPSHPAVPPVVHTATSYTVRRGDTLGSIARRYHTSVSVLSRLNGLRNPNRIRVGQHLRLPGSAAPAPKSKPASSRYTVRRGDTLGSIAKRNHTTVSRLRALNHIRNANRIYAGQKLRLR